MCKLRTPTFDWSLFAVAFPTVYFCLGEAGISSDKSSGFTSALQNKLLKILDLDLANQFKSCLNEILTDQKFRNHKKALLRIFGSPDFQLCDFVTEEGGKIRVSKIEHSVLEHLLCSDKQLIGGYKEVVDALVGYSYNGRIGTPTRAQFWTDFHGKQLKAAADIQQQERTSELEEDKQEEPLCHRALLAVREELDWPGKRQKQIELLSTNTPDKVKASLRPGAATSRSLIQFAQGKIQSRPIENSPLWTLIPCKFQNPAFHPYAAQKSHKKNALDGIEGPLLRCMHGQKNSCFGFFEKIQHFYLKTLGTTTDQRSALLRVALKSFNKATRQTRKTAGQNAMLSSAQEEATTTEDQDPDPDDTVVDVDAKETRLRVDTRQFCFCWPLPPVAASTQHTTIAAGVGAVEGAVAASNDIALRNAPSTEEEDTPNTASSTSLGTPVAASEIIAMPAPTAPTPTTTGATPKVKSINVYDTCIARIAENRLNDTVIDFFLLKLYLDKIATPGSTISVTHHIFNTFFYKHYCNNLKRVETRSKDLPAYRSLTKTAQMNWCATHALIDANMDQYIHDIDLFKKDFLLVPINSDLHWSVIVVCHSSQFQTYLDYEYKHALLVEQSILEGDTDTNDTQAQHEYTEHFPTYASTDPYFCMLHLDSLNYHKSQEIGDRLVQVLYYAWATKKAKATGQSMDAVSELVPLKYAYQMDDPSHTRFGRCQHMDMCQQVGSLDCGVFTCYYIHKFIEKTTCISSDISNKDNIIVTKSMYSAKTWTWLNRGWFSRWGQDARSIGAALRKELKKLVDACHLAYRKQVKSNHVVINVDDDEDSVTAEVAGTTAPVDEESEATPNPKRSRKRNKRRSKKGTGR